MQSTLFKITTVMIIILFIVLVSMFIGYFLRDEEVKPVPTPRASGERISSPAPTKVVKKSGDIKKEIESGETKPSATPPKPSAKPSKKPEEKATPKPKTVVEPSQEAIQMEKFLIIKVEILCQILKKKSQKHQKQLLHQLQKHQTKKSNKS